MNKTLLSSICIAVLALAATPITAKAQPILTGLPDIASPFDNMDLGFNGGWEWVDPNNTDTPGIWYDSAGWYVKPKADGSGWEAGVLEPGDWNSGWGSTPITMSWTPEGGWVIDQAPPGYFLASGRDENGNFIPYTNSPTDPRYSFSINYGDRVFNSTDFEPGIPEGGWGNTWDIWDNTLSAWYAARPHLPNPYGDPNAASIAQKAANVVEGLIFQDGQWIPEN